MGLVLLSTMKNAKRQEVRDPPRTASPVWKRTMWQYILGVIVLMGLLLLSTMKSAKHQGVWDPPKTASPVSKNIMWQNMTYVPQSTTRGNTC